MLPRLILASASPARLKTLRNAGIEPLVEVVDLDEEALLDAAGPLTPSDAVLALARAKAEHVLARTAQGAELVLGCDSMLELEGRVLGKPRDATEALERWHQMRGRTGALHTGHWLTGTLGTVGATASTTVHFADLTDEEIEAYVATGEPLVVAGAFTVDGLGGPFVSAIDGDFHNVVGLSLPLLRELLAAVGVPITALWQR